MDRDRWKAVNEIFHAALELPASERKKFVCIASNGDSEFQSDVDRLLEADQHAGRYLESPLFMGEYTDVAASPPPFQVGDVLKNRFRIIRPVGEGGMGHVFEAYDAELKVRVALKVIRSEIARNPTALEFFRREVRTARTITHPNVCRTFDLDRGFLSEMAEAREEFFFLTMEFLDGETLAARLKRTGPLDPELALVSARQIALGLDAAHAAGIVHRDIKPANIMLVAISNGSVQQTRAVITDFGLARINPLHPSIMASAFSHGGTVGTLAYMAPEQFRPGSPVSTATDVYAFGLVLFEMVTGARAFPSANLLSGIAQRLAGPPPSPRSITPELPQAWEAVIECCLRLAAEDRFQSAGQVVEALGGVQISRPLISKLTPSTDDSLRARWSHRQLFLFAAEFILASLTLSVVGLRLYESTMDSKVDPGALVYLTSLKNETGEHAFDNLTELLKASLGQSAQINLLDQSRVGDILERMTKPPDTLIAAPVAREIAMRAGAVRVIFPKVIGSAGRYELKIDIQQLDATGPLHIRNVWSKSFPWTRHGSTTESGAIPEELLHAVRDASDWIRLEVGESRNDIARLDAPPEEVTTGNWQALADYEFAEQLASMGKRQDAVSALRKAIKEDPEFALAYARLGDSLVNLTDRTGGYQAYLKALELGATNRLSLRERDRIRGMYAQDTSDFQTSEDEFREYSLFYGHDYLGWFYRGRALSMLGRLDKAIDVLKQAHSVAPDKVGALSMLVKVSVLSGDLAQARVWLEKVKAQNSDDILQFVEGLVSFAEGNLQASFESFSAMEKSSQPWVRSQSLRYRADLAAEQGDYAKGVELLTEALKEPSEATPKLLDRAFLNGRMGMFDKCLVDLEHAMPGESDPDTVIEASEIIGRTLPFARGSSAVRLRTILGSLENKLPTQDFGLISQIARSRVRAEVHLSKGEVSAALVEFRRADKLQAPLSSREYLGRALELSASHHPKTAEARNELAAALDAYERVAFNLGVVWQVPTDYVPGSYADELEDWLRVAESVSSNDAEHQAAKTALAKLRPNSQPAQRSLIGLTRYSNLQSNIDVNAKRRKS